ncbi:cystatin [Thalassophryne amazonica]|uniref:cystatin n=1 Tax=Thalassophryne amazonica TaxID=390379 RepID=UPI0014715DD3|nr:cystatin [Thalassophryne amazonica]
MDVQNATYHCVDMFNTKSKAKKIFKLVSVDSAQIQVTSEINYRIEAILARSNCLKVDYDKWNSCNLEKRRLKCTFNVASHPNKEKYNMHKFSCNKM